MSAAEHSAALPCDEFVPGVARRMTRGVDVAAPPAAVWPWLGMLRVAPYSYDWIDNLGRRSPRTLDPSLPPLGVGQRVLIAFRVESVEEGRSFTCVAGGGGRLGPAAMTYAVSSAGTGRSRLLGRLVVPEPSRARALANDALALGDLVMMRKQLRTLAALAGRDARR